MIVHNLINGLLAPANLGLLLVVLTAILAWKKCKKSAKLVGAFACIWLLFWSLPCVVGWLGCHLERYYPPVLTQDLPEADAICILGGGMQTKEPWHPFAEMSAGADRVWRGAQLYKAGKAKKIIISGPKSGVSTIPLLVDLGVKPEDIVTEEAARNTEEEGRLVGNLVKSWGGKRILLVTSAWHMRRAAFLFDGNGLEVVPVACDYESLSGKDPSAGFQLKSLIPNTGTLAGSTQIFKEYYAYWGYRIQRWL